LLCNNTKAQSVRERLCAAGRTCVCCPASLLKPKPKTPTTQRQPFCKPPEGVKKAANMANLGTILQGLRIENSPYNLTVMTKELGKNACGPNGAYPALTKDQAALIKAKIDKKYRINMVLDNLPVTVYDLENDVRG
jgi:hypothetical protein